MCIETISVADSHDTSYLNDLNYKPKRGRQRIESASDMDVQSTFSEDVNYAVRLFE